jgi:probable rRNA maturation factor
VTVDVSYDGVRIPLARARIIQLASFALRRERVPTAVLSFVFVTTRRIRALHGRYQGQHTPTDIVTLQHRPAAPLRSPPVADIFIAPQVARENAGAFGATMREEIARLVVHGTLHALGWTHANNAERTASPMWRRQEHILRSAQREGIW